jgi:uncharacterized protein
LPLDLRLEPALTTTHQRDAPLDALRVLALLGVFVVNWVGYLNGPASSSPLGPAQPAGGALSVAAMWLLMTLVQSKAYPLMAFAVGYGLQAAWRRDHAAAAFAGAADAALFAQRKRRQRDVRMALLGVLHGVLLYSGDILLLYAIVGWVVVRYAGLGGHALRGKWRKWFVMWWVVNGVIFLMAAVLGAGLGATDSPATPAHPTDATFLGSAGLWGAWWTVNFKSWLSAVSWSNWFLLPQFVVFAMLGMWTARWQLCASGAASSSGLRQRFAQRFWQGHVHAIAGRRSLCAALVVNAALSWFWLQDLAGATRLGLWSSAFWYLGTAWLALAYLCAFMRWARTGPAQAWLAEWASAAHMSLSAYLALSALLVLSLHTGFLRFENTLPRAATALVLWMFAIWVSRRISAHLTMRGRKPWLEGWISGRSSGSEGPGGPGGPGGSGQGG